MWTKRYVAMQYVCALRTDVTNPTRKVLDLFRRRSQRAGEVRDGAGGSLQLFMLMHALQTCFGSRASIARQIHKFKTL